MTGANCGVYRKGQWVVGGCAAGRRFQALCVFTKVISEMKGFYDGIFKE